MIIQLHTPEGTVEIDGDTVTDTELSALGITREGLNECLGIDADYLRAVELLGTSPTAITQPEIWELLRIIGRKLGYLSD